MARRSDHTPEELAALILATAKRIVREDGIDALTARKIASAAGYTVGTIYQYFGNMDDLVLRMNGETLGLLYEECSKVPQAGSSRDRLLGLAKAFVQFGDENKNEWEAVISYRYATEQQWSPDYDVQVNQLLDLMMDATRPLYSKRDRGRQTQDVLMLWASMYGIFSLHANDRLGAPVDEMTRRLIDTFVGAH